MTNVTEKIALVITDAYVRDDAKTLMSIAHALNRFDSTENAYIHLQVTGVIK